MAEPLSVSASIVGLISLGLQVTSNLLKYYDSLRGQNAHVDKTLRNLEDVTASLQFLHEAVQKRSDALNTDHGLLKRIVETSERCKESIEELRNELEKFGSSPKQQSLKAVAIKTGRKLAYPFRESTLKKLEEEIGEIRDCISLFLSVLQLKDQDYVRNEIDTIKELITLLSSHQLTESIVQWLKAPDPTSNHYDACNKRHKSTGLWFVEDCVFKAWLTQESSLLWLNGSPGSGKSVLCSTVIQTVFQHRNGNPKIGICFFYFTFADESKQDVYGMIRAIVIQLSSQVSGRQSDLKALKEKYDNRPPPLQELIALFRSMIDRFEHVYLLLDALDESPKAKARQELLQTLTEFEYWALNGLHILVTSRNEPDIREHLEGFAKEVRMDNQKVDKDIGDYVDSILKTSPAFRKWSSQHDKIRRVLTSGAQGAFRWTECQLQSLAHCPRSPAHLERCLASLPPTLDETYARILLGIDPTFREDARRILLMLCFTTRPLTVDEAIGGLAVQLGEPLRVAPECRLLDEVDIFRICPSLIEISSYYNDDEAEVAGTKTLNVSHFSVQEYLTSSRILSNEDTAFFYLNPADCHAELARLCLAYLVDPEVVEFRTPVALGEPRKDLYEPRSTPDMAFYYYAAKNYFEHFQNSGIASEEVEYLILKFLNNDPAFDSWVLLTGDWKIFEQYVGLYRSPINCAAALNLVGVASHLLGVPCKNYNRPTVCTADDVSRHRSDIDTAGTYFGNPLHVASGLGHKDMVQFLLEEGADPNDEVWDKDTEDPHTALRWACLLGHEDIVQYLLENGAIADLQGMYGGTALLDACRSGYQSIAKHLLDNGADPNDCIDSYGAPLDGDSYCDSALSRAIASRNLELVRLLLERGASPDDSHSSSRSPLESASSNGDMRLVKLLLQYGANVNIHRGGPLKSAVYASQETMVQELIAAGVHIEMTEDAYGSLVALAIRAARERGDVTGAESLIRTLIDAGANVNLIHEDQLDSRKFGFCLHDTCNLTPLQHASLRGYEDIASILLHNGADINSKQGRAGGALQAAVISGKKDLVELLILHGADVNDTGGDFVSPFCAAYIWNREDIKQLLLDHGAQDMSEVEVIQLARGRLQDIYSAFREKGGSIASLTDLKKLYASIPLVRSVYNIPSAGW